VIEALQPLDIVTMNHVIEMMNHVIEHLPDPSNVVRQLVKRLKPDGAFEGQTPNTNSYECPSTTDRLE
jgi:2-polyprenyl-3-methyl-5-hydroxy-6-metoxy-1,4-benzoquinol methylase